MKKLFIVIILLSFICSYAQTIKRLDSLIQVSKKQNNHQLINTLNEISWEFKNSNADSALIYAKKALKTAKIINENRFIAAAYNSVASAFEANSNIDSAEIYHQRSLKIKLKINDSVGVADSYNNLGIIEDIKGNYDLALKNYFKALKIYEEHAKDFEKVPTVLINIGIVYKKQKEYNKVLDYYHRALKIYKKNNFEIGETIVTGNIGSVLINLQEYKQSIQYSEKAKELYSKLGYSRYVPYMLENIGIAKDSLKQYASARTDYLAAISFFENDQNLYELSNTKISLANNYTLTNEFVPAKKELLEALAIINKNGFKEMKVKALRNLSRVYWLTNDLKNAYITQNLYSIEKDSLSEAEKIKTIYELETKYETEKKEKEILSHRANLAEKELHINQKNTQIIGLVVLALVISLLGYVLFNQQKLKTKQLQKEGELKEALAEIESQNKLQEQRLAISRDLHDTIGAQLTFIISSIDNLQYGYKITNEKLTNRLTSITNFTKETIYELRDTIWAMNKNDISLEDLQARISNFIDKGQLFSNGTNFSFITDSSIDEELKFSSLKGMNIYRIIQESINNAVKYAEANTITVCFKNTENGLNVSIKDNGKGFDASSVALGNGLSNMKKRASEIGSILYIESKINEGTTIQFEI
ncbi:tetratricopeptide repeat protein [Mariniflexile sp.]|uniref:tetratricopeptide repeat-containing sensor histidine kinase n=1 Tax=Mariniflexile sp. TaxID=1979402 RepID=UPI003566E400